MPETPRTSSDQSPAKMPTRTGGALLERQRWIVFVAPFLVYMLMGILEPSPTEPGGAQLGLAIPYSSYPLLYTLKIALTLAAVALVAPGYRQFPWRMTRWAFLAGVVGVFLWVALCRLNVLQQLAETLDSDWLRKLGARPAFNPFEQMAESPTWMWGFLAVRFLGLALVVPLIEEMFLRGFVMRFVMAADWWTVPLGKVSAAAVAASVVLPVLSHPGEMLAAVVWFGMVTGLMVKTRNLWDCVAAHAVTNLLLGIYVVASGLLGHPCWELW
jgi:uncharacterized protein